MLLGFDWCDCSEGKDGVIFVFGGIGWGGGGGGCLVIDYI